MPAGTRPIRGFDLHSIVRMSGVLSLAFEGGWPIQAFFWLEWGSSRSVTYLYALGTVIGSSSQFLPSRCVPREYLRFFIIPSLRVLCEGEKSLYSPHILPREAPRAHCRVSEHPRYAQVLENSLAGGPGLILISIPTTQYRVPVLAFFARTGVNAIDTIVLSRPDESFRC